MKINAFFGPHFRLSLGSAPHWPQSNHDWNHNRSHWNHWCYWSPLLRIRACCGHIDPTLQTRRLKQLLVPQHARNNFPISPKNAQVWQCLQDIALRLCSQPTRSMPNKMTAKHTIWQQLVTETMPWEWRWIWNHAGSNGRIFRRSVPNIDYFCDECQFFGIGRVCWLETIQGNSVKWRIKIGKRPIKQAKRSIKAMVLVGISISCSRGCFRGYQPWWKQHLRERAHSKVHDILVLDGVLQVVSVFPCWLMTTLIRRL